MQILIQTERELARWHNAERTYVNVYTHARGAGMSKRDAGDNAALSTRSGRISWERRRELQGLVEDALRAARVPVT